MFFFGVSAAGVKNDVKYDDNTNGVEIFNRVKE